MLAEIKETPSLRVIFVIVMTTAESEETPGSNPLASCEQLCREADEPGQVFRGGKEHRKFLACDRELPAEGAL